MTAMNTLRSHEGKVCPACQTVMDLEVGALPSQELFWFHVDTYRCPCCGRTSLGGPFFG